MARGREDSLAMQSSSLQSAAEAELSPVAQTALEGKQRTSLLTDAELARLDQHDALRIEHVSKRFAKHGGRHWFALGRRHGERRKRGPRIIRAVEDVSLTVKRREIVGVLGSNGSGKSTLIRLISTLLLPDAGSVKVFGHDVMREERAVQRLINRVSVEAAFFRKLSPMENLLYSARLYGVPGAEAKREDCPIPTPRGVKAGRVAQPQRDMARGMPQRG